MRRPLMRRAGWSNAASTRSSLKASRRAGTPAASSAPIPPKRSACSLWGSRSPRTRWRSFEARRRGAAMEIVPVPAFTDNYLWLVHDEASGETAVVDPGDAAPVIAEAERRGWVINQIWNTHWHPDHSGGNLA